MDDGTTDVHALCSAEIHDMGLSQTCLMLLHLVSYEYGCVWTWWKPAKWPFNWDNYDEPWIIGLLFRQIPLHLFSYNLRLWSQWTKIVFNKGLETASLTFDTRPEASLWSTVFGRTLCPAAAEFFPSVWRVTSPALLRLVGVLVSPSWHPRRRAPKLWRFWRLKMTQGLVDVLLHLCLWICRRLPIYICTLEFCAHFRILWRSKSLWGYGFSADFGILEDRWKMMRFFVVVANDMITFRRCQQYYTII